jgi:hypothetical protein
MLKTNELIGFELFPIAGLPDGRLARRHSGMHPLQPFPEVFLPRLRQCRNAQRPPQRGHVRVAIPLFRVQTSDLRDGHAVWVPGNELDHIAAADFSLAGDGQVESRPAAYEESLHHVVGLKSNTEFVTREARLRHEYFRGPDREPVAKMDRVFEQTVGGEVLPKRRPSASPGRATRSSNNRSVRAGSSTRP